MKKIIIIVIVMLIAALVFWFFFALRSYVAMGIYSAQHEADSVMRRNGFDIEIPSGKGWYPFVMTYNTHGFKAWSGIDADMSIMYNFGAFDAQTRTSSIYDQSSDKYSAFYGAYVVSKHDDAFGFKDEDIDIREIALAVEYDYTQLVIKDFGCQSLVFNIDNYDIATDLVYAGSDGWMRMDARITANGAAHNFEEHKRPYFQYGIPMTQVETDFAPITLYGRVYAKYFEKFDCTVMIYVIAPSENTVAQCDESVLEKTKISSNLQ